MVLHIIVRRNYDGKLPWSIKCHNLHSFKKEVFSKEGYSYVRVSLKRDEYHGSALFIIPLMFSLVLEN